MKTNPLKKLVYAYHCLCFTLLFKKVHKHYQAGLNFAQNSLTNFPIFQFFNNGYQSSFMIVSFAELLKIEERNKVKLLLNHFRSRRFFTP